MGLLWTFLELFRAFEVELTAVHSDEVAGQSVANESLFHFHSFQNDFVQNFGLESVLEHGVEEAAEVCMQPLVAADHLVRKRQSCGSQKEKHLKVEFDATREQESSKLNCKTANTRNSEKLNCAAAARGVCTPQLANSEIQLPRITRHKSALFEPENGAERARKKNPLHAAKSHESFRKRLAAVHPLRRPRRLHRHRGNVVDCIK